MIDYIKDELQLDIRYFDSIDSTSLYLKRLICENQRIPDLVIAREQTNGQGRVGKKFYSPSATGLYMTFAVPCDRLYGNHTTPRLSLALCRSVESVFSVSCSVKWVNDIYLADKKIAGILCQRVEDYYLIGVGVNVKKPKSIPDDLKGRLGYLCAECEDKKFADLVVSFYRNMMNHCNLLSEKEVLSQYRKRCIHIGKEVSIQYNGNDLQGICSGIADDFSIIINVEGKDLNFSSGILTLL
jgi:BirA family biotin operon repressor/biotin-[acetyl-CoA-carboxylase] ligase